MLSCRVQIFYVYRCGAMIFNTVRESRAQILVVLPLVLTKGSGRVRFCKPCWSSAYWSRSLAALVTLLHSSQVMRLKGRVLRQRSRLRWTSLAPFPSATCSSLILCRSAALTPDAAAQVLQKIAMLTLQMKTTLIQSEHSVY